MLVALTGSEGLIGSAVAKALISRGHKIRSIGRRPSYDVVIDLAAPTALAAEALDGVDALVHAAGVTDEDFSDRNRAFVKAEQGANVLLSAARHAGVGNLVYVSSAHVYGPLQGRIDEQSPLNPKSDYAIAHSLTEQLFARAGDAAAEHTLILRPCAAFGIPPSLARFARWSLMPFDFPRQAFNGKIVLKTDGRQRRNFVPIELLGSVTAHWLEHPSSGLTISNAPGSEEMSIYDFAVLCAKVRQETSGEACEVHRPQPATTQDGKLFEYRSVHSFEFPAPSLRDYVHSMMRLLSAHENRHAP